jgi:hypothetical protein
MAKEGSTIGGLMDSLGTGDERVAAVRRADREPGQQVHAPAVRTGGDDDQLGHPFAKSLVDYIFRWMGMQFIPGYRAANAPQRNRPESSPEIRSPGAGRAPSTEDPIWKAAEVKDWQADRKNGLAGGLGHDGADAGSGLAGSIAGTTAAPQSGSPAIS